MKMKKYPINIHFTEVPHFQISNFRFLILADATDLKFEIGD